MGYDFKPRHKEVGGFHLGAFSFGWMMDGGPGLIIGYDEGVEAGTYVFIADKQGRDLMSNDGFYIYSKECKLIAKLLRAKMKVVEFRNKEFASLEQWKKDFIKEHRPHMYGEVREDFIEKAYRFADWLEICGGCGVW